MMNIREIKPSDLVVSIEVDPYVPIAVRTFSAPIGAVFYRVGNFETSLVEIPIDPLSGTIRGVKVVSLDRVGASIDDSALQQLQGLPVVTQESIPQKRLDEQRKVTVALADGRLVIDWSEGQQLDTKAVHGRLSFLIGGGALLGAVVESLSQAEQHALLVHMPSATTPDSPSSTPRG
jgi:hypothetical protein